MKKRSNWEHRQTRLDVTTAPIYQQLNSPEKTITEYSDGNIEWEAKETISIKCKDFILKRLKALKSVLALQQPLIVVAIMQFKLVETLSTMVLRYTETPAILQIQIRLRACRNTNIPLRNRRKGSESPAEKGNTNVYH